MTTQLETPPEQVMKVVELLPDDELDQFVKKVMVYRAQRKAPHLSARESELLLKINRGLSDDLLQRWEELIDKRDNDLLTPEEYAELLKLTEQVEWFDSERAECLAELALLRGIPLPDLMQQLGIQKQPHG